MTEPFFLAIEGTDNSGKTSAATELTRHLVNRGLPTTLLREPGSTQIGDAVKQIFQQRLQVENLTEVFLFEAARHQMVQTRVKPALTAGSNVITARYTTSTVAYQGYARGVDLELIERLNQLATGGVQPDLTVVLDVPVSTARNRAQVGKNSFEIQNNDFYEKVRHGYLETARLNPDNHRIIDASRPAKDVLDDLIEVANSLLRR